MATLKRESKGKYFSSDLETLRHSTSHLLAAAVQKIYGKGVQLGIGPAIDDGFYYDFDLKQNFTPKDLEKIAEEMQNLVAEGLPFEPVEVSRKEAEDILKKSNQKYKLELLSELPKSAKITFYRTGDFIDMCAGPHVRNTKELGVFTLTKIAGAYWRGSEKNPMMQRIYGVAFRTPEELDSYLKMMAEAELRDHKKLGRELELFMFHETAPGMPYWLPKGLALYQALVAFWRTEHQMRGYQEIASPLLNKKELYETSGHWEHYRENMFICHTEEKETYAVKAMNCPNAMVVYASKMRSYKDLPLRFGDTDSLHRFERSGTLNGLLRVRHFSQDDAHIFVTEDQIKEEYQRIFEIIDHFYAIFNMEYSFNLSTRPESFMGDVKTWNKAEKELKDILKNTGKPFKVLEGDGAFYGPKIDILMKDALGREWQMGTIQLDFQIPKSFNLKYTTSDGKEKTPVAIHRVVYGSLERFIGILIEHYAGAFPTWIAPVQVKVLPISDKHAGQAKALASQLFEAEIRVEVDERNETIGAKIRDAEKQKTPYMLILGDREIKEGKVAVRGRGRGDMGTHTVQDFLYSLKQEINEKK